MLGLGLGINRFMSILASIFQSLCSFLFDGVSKTLVIPKGSVREVFDGTSKLTLGMVFKSEMTGIDTLLWSGSFFVPRDMYILYNPSTDSFRLDYWDTGGSQRTRIFASAGIILNDWNTIILSIDTNDDAVLYVNDIIIAPVSGAISGLMTTTGSDLVIGDSFGFNRFKGALNSAFLLNDTVTDLEATQFYHNGEPLNPETVWGSKVKWSNLPQDAYDFDSVNSEWAVPNGVNIPNITKSITLNGATKYIEFNNVLPSIITNTLGTISATFTPLALGATNYIMVFSTGVLDDWIFIRSLAGKVEAQVVTGGVNQWIHITDNVVLEVGKQVTIDVVQDTISPKIYVDSVLVAQTSTNTTDVTRWFNHTSGINKAYFGVANLTGSLTGYSNFIFKSCSIENIAATQLQLTESYNEGNPLNPQTQFGINNKLFVNSDNAIWDGAKFNIIDSVNSITSTSVNMVEADLKYRGTGVSYSENMIEGDKDCTVNPY